MAADKATEEAQAAGTAPASLASTGKPSSIKDPVAAVSSWVDDNLQVVRGALSVVVVGSAVASVFLVRRAIREAREALTITTNRDVVRLIESMRSSTPVTLTMRVESVNECGRIRVSHNPWWKRCANV